MLTNSYLNWFFLIPKCLIVVMFILILFFYLRIFISNFPNLLPKVLFFMYFFLTPWLLCFFQLKVAEFLHFWFILFLINFLNFLELNFQNYLMQISYKLLPYKLLIINLTHLIIFLNLKFLPDTLLKTINLNFSSLYLIAFIKLWFIYFSILI